MTVIEMRDLHKRRLTFVLSDGTGAGELVAHLASVGSLRDLRVVEPDIEEVVARLYAERD